MKPAFLIVDKPPEVTSHDVVAMVRAVTGIKKIGHTGTLDPFATGVLPLALGPATKLISYLDESLKVYDATIRFGTMTDTGDPTGTVVRTGPLPELTEKRILGVLAEFSGEQMQRPPMYSAIKHKGKPLYYYARQGLHVDVPPRPITIYGIQLNRFDSETMHVTIRCSRGTYARVLAQDIAEKLGTVGHLEALSRPQSGPFRIENALSIEVLAELAALDSGHAWRDVLMGKGPREERVKWKHRDTVRELLGQYFVPPIQVLTHLSSVDVSDSEAKFIKNGGRVPMHPSKDDQENGFLIVHQAELLALAQRTPKGIKSIRMIGNG